MGWISVKDKMPDVNKYPEYDYEYVTVLVVDGGKTRPMIYNRAKVRGKTVYRWKWMWDTINKYNEITHWMPLPDPPEEADDEKA